MLYGIESLQVIVMMYSSNDGAHPTINDVEAILNSCVKSLDTADQLTRHTLAQLVGHILASTQEERIVSMPEPVQKSKREQENMDDDVMSSSQAEVKRRKLHQPRCSSFFRVTSTNNTSLVKFVLDYTTFMRPCSPIWALGGWKPIFRLLLDI